MIAEPGLLGVLVALTLIPWPLLTQAELLKLQNQCFGLFWVFKLVSSLLIVASGYLFVVVVPLNAFHDVYVVLLFVSLLFRQGWRYYFFHDGSPYARLFALLNQAASTAGNLVLAGFAFDTTEPAAFVLGLVAAPFDLYVLYLTYLTNRPPPVAEEKEDIETGRIGLVSSRPPSSSHRMKRPGSGFGLAGKKPRSIGIVKPRAAGK